MDKLEQWPCLCILGWSEEGNDGLDESNHKDTEAKQRMVLLVLDGFKFLLNQDWDDASYAECNC